MFILKQTCVESSLNTVESGCSNHEPWRKGGAKLGEGGSSFYTNNIKINRTSCY